MRERIYKRTFNGHSLFRWFCCHLWRREETYTNEAIEFNKWKCNHCRLEMNEIIIDWAGIKIKE